jgi:hypothetical protein
MRRENEIARHCEERIKAFKPVLGPLKRQSNPDGATTTGRPSS